ncbi:MAG: 6-bladed beta-propeller [Balneolaceae bacterium]
MKFTFTLLFFVIFLSSCSGSPETEQTPSGNLTDVTHPTPENNPSDDEVADILVIGKHQQEKFSMIKDQLRNIEEYTSIGNFEGKGQEMFGRIEDVAIDSRNRIFLLDSGRQIVGVFTVEGEYLATLGGRGQGPGEFERALSMTKVKDQWLLVGNVFRIEAFDISGEIEFKESVQLQRPVNDLCAIGDTLYVHSIGFTDDDEVSEENYRHMIHAYSLQSFDHLYSFGQSYKSTNPFVIDRMSIGSLGCNEASNMVVFAFERMNVIQGYSADNGSLEWVTRIDDFNLPAITESIRDGRPAMSYGIPQSGIMDIISAPVAFDKEYMILQVLRSTPGSATNRMYHTFVLNSANGTGSYLSDEIPEISDYFNNYIVSRGVTQDLMISQIYRVISEQ